MRFGTYYFLQVPPGISDAEVIQEEFAQMLLSEELGYDTVWLTEHHFTEYGISVSPMALAAAIAARTQRIHIALAAAILPFHDPIRLAEEVAFVDILSRGRLRVGLGRGNYTNGKPMDGVRWFRGLASASRFFLISSRSVTREKESL